MWGILPKVSYIQERQNGCWGGGGVNKVPCLTSGVPRLKKSTFTQTDNSDSFWLLFAAAVKKCLEEIFSLHLNLLPEFLQEGAPPKSHVSGSLRWGVVTLGGDAELQGLARASEAIAQYHGPAIMVLWAITSLISLLRCTDRIDHPKTKDWHFSYR